MQSINSERALNSFARSIVTSSLKFFCVLQVDVTENQDRIPSLLCLPAHDPDEGANANLTYSITSGNNAGLFSIDPVLGVLSVELSLNYEGQPLHKLVVMAADGGVPRRMGTTKVAVRVYDANDAPEFEKRSYEGTEVLVLMLMALKNENRPAVNQCAHF